MLRVLIVLLGLAALALGQGALRSHTEASDMMAQAICAGHYFGKGWVYAIRRQCASNRNHCHHICKYGVVKSADRQTQNRNTWHCYDAIHVYKQISIGRPGYNRMSHKMFRYANCWHTGCGPNYCCCAVDA